MIIKIFLGLLLGLFLLFIYCSCRIANEVDSHMEEINNEEDV